MKPVALVLAVLVLLSGCGQFSGSESGSSAFPAETAEDWVTYGDYLVELTAVSEETLQPDENELSAGEGWYRRQFTLTVDKVWWARPGVKHVPPVRQQWVSGGWQFRDGNLKRREKVKDPRQLEVGRHYVAIFTYDSRGLAEWGEAWWCFGRIPLVDGTLRRVKAVREHGTEPIYRQLRGLTPGEAGALLRRTRPDPDVVPYLDQDAPERYQRGVGDNLPPATPARHER